MTVNSANAPAYKLFNTIKIERKDTTGPARAYSDYAVSIDDEAAIPCLRDHVPPDMSGYSEEEYLQISGIQHFVFCRRQWALIHIENQWSDNLLTVEGELLHEHAHDEGLTEKRGDLLTVRGLHVSSTVLGVSGACDVVEFKTFGKRRLPFWPSWKMAAISCGV